MTKSVDIGKYKYSGYGIGFDSKGSFLFSSGGFGKVVIIFGTDMTNFIHANNKKKNFSPW